VTVDPFYGGLPAEPSSSESEDSRSASNLNDAVKMLPVAAWPPAFAVLVAEFVVIGEPKPAGSKTSGVATRMVGGRRVPIINPKTGLPKTFTKDSSGKAGESWRNDVSDAAMRARRFDVPLDGRLAAEFVFVTPWKPGDFGKRDGRLKDSVRMSPHVRPDALKLARAVEDACTGILWTDDARITEERIRKVCVQPQAGPQRVEVRVWTLPTTVGEYRLAKTPAEFGETGEGPAAQLALS
jgi:Holliday junction resolvase RusA-like endonuclease